MFATLATSIYRKPFVLLPLAAFAWSGNFVVGRLVNNTITPIELAFWRWIVALLLVLPFALRHLHRDRAILLHNWRIMLLLSITGVALFNTLVYFGLRSTTVLNGLLMQSVVPVLIFVLAFLLFREQPRASQLAGLFLSLVGVMVVLTQGNPLAVLNNRLNVGDLWVFAAALCYALYSTLLRRRPPVHALSFLAVTFMVGSLALLPAYLAEALTRSAAMSWSGEAVLAIGYVGVFPSVLAYFCFNRGVELVGAARAGQFFHLMPVFGGVLSFLLLGEGLHLFQAVGATLIGLGIVVASYRSGHEIRGKPNAGRHGQERTSMT